MPTYEYHCDTCARNFDVVQSFSDAPLEACPTCGAPVRKVFGTVGIVFKGSGFYKTDSRTAAKSSTKAGDGSSSGDGASGSDGAGSDSGTSGSDSGKGSGDSAAPAAPAGSKTPAASKPDTSPSGNGSSRTAKESAKT